jgi:hypothetical protein
MTSYVTKKDNRHNARSAESGKIKEYFKCRTPMFVMICFTTTTANRSTKIIKVTSTKLFLIDKSLNKQHNIPQGYGRHYMQMTSAELTDLMIDSSQNAVTTTKEEFNLTLDGSEQSIKLVDDIILGWVDRYKDPVLEESAVFTICNIYGAYIGEIFRNKVGGNWAYDESDPSAPYIVLNYAGSTYAFAGICYQRLVNDNKISVKNYFDQALANNLH